MVETIRFSIFVATILFIGCVAETYSRVKSKQKKEEEEEESPLVNSYCAIQHFAICMYTLYIHRFSRFLYTLHATHSYLFVYTIYVSLPVARK